MAQGGFQTVFEIGLKTFPWVGLVMPVVFIVMGMCLIRFSGGNQIRQIVGGFAVLFCGLVVVLLGVRLIPDFVEERHAYVTGKYSVVDGPVEDFHPMPFQGHQNERFRVGAKSFSYSSFDLTSCFHSAASHGGPIRPGLNVRIFFTEGCILRLDVRR